MIKNPLKQLLIKIPTVSNNLAAFVLIKSGITISESLGVISEQSSSKQFKKVVTKVDEQIRKGKRLSAALATFPKAFDSLFVNIVNVGEESGTLEENLEYLATDLEAYPRLVGAIEEGHDIAIGSRYFKGAEPH